MAVEASTAGIQWTISHLNDLWHANRLKIEDLPDAYNNEQLAKCEHVMNIFGNGHTRVPDKDMLFYHKVCKRSTDAITKHPVLVIGNWRQGKSSLVNSLVDKQAAATGRHTRTTTDVRFYPMHADAAGEVLLADTPGLEPDTEHDIMGLFREALCKMGCSPDVHTGLILLVVAGTAQGISSLTSQKVFDWIQGTYAQARRDNTVKVTILPVITHGDTIDAEEMEGDRRVVLDRLRQIGGGTQARADLLEPSVVCNPDAKRRRAGWGIEDLKNMIVQQVHSVSALPEFKMQWSHMLTSDLKASVRHFHEEHPHEETETRLFHRTMHAVLATHNKCSSNVETALPNPSWHLLAIIEKKLRNEEPTAQRWKGKALSFLPCPPGELSPVLGAAVTGLTLRQAYMSRTVIVDMLIKVLAKVR